MNNLSKRLIATLLLIGLGISCVSCESKGASESQTQQDSKFEVIEPTKENLLALGSKQTKDIKGVLERYSYKVEKRNVSLDNDEFDISVDENDLKDYGLSVGYEIASGDVDIEGTNANFKIGYSSGLGKDGSPEYDCNIYLLWPNDTEFNMDNYEHFPELVKAAYGDDYDINELNTRISQTVEKAKNNEDKFFGNISTNVGSYVESIYVGEYTSKHYSVRYSMKLRKSN